MAGHRKVDPKAPKYADMDLMLGLLDLIPCLVAAAAWGWDVEIIIDM